jgi:hypothetical protein
MKILFMIFSLTVSAYAARIPEALVRDQYISTEGFSLNFKEGNWLRTEAPGNIQNKMDVLFRSALKESQSTLSVRVDYDENSKSLKDYVSKWLKTYSSFKMDVLGHKYFKTENQDMGFVVDIKSNPEKRARQVIFFRGSKAVVLTCTDTHKKFSETLKSCNDVIRTFTWIDSTPVSTSAEQK